MKRGERQPLVDESRDLSNKTWREILEEYGIAPAETTSQVDKDKAREILRRLLEVGKIKEEMEEFEGLIKENKKREEFKKEEENFRINLVRAYFVFEGLSAKEKVWVRESINPGLRNLVKMYETAKGFILAEGDEEKQLFASEFRRAG